VSVCVWKKNSSTVILPLTSPYTDRFQNYIHMALRCRRAAVVSSLFLFFSTPNLWGHWTDLSQTWTHIHLWLLFEKFGPNSFRHLPPLYGLGQNRFFGTDFELWSNIYVCNGTWYQQSERNLSIYRDSYMPPNLVKFGPDTAENGWRVLTPPKFSYWETLPALPRGRYITDIRQTLTRVM